MTLTPQFLTLTDASGRPVTLALAHIVRLLPEVAPGSTTHVAGCPETGNDPDLCDCPWPLVETHTRIVLSGWDHVVRVSERYADILRLINTRIAGVIDGADIIARVHAPVEAAAPAGPPL